MTEQELLEQERIAREQLDRTIDGIIIKATFMTEYNKSLWHPDLYPDPARTVEEELDRIFPSENEDKSAVEEQSTCG